MDANMSIKNSFFHFEKKNLIHSNHNQTIKIDHFLHQQHRKFSNMYQIGATFAHHINLQQKDYYLLKILKLKV